MLQLRKTSNQRTASQTPNDGSGGGGGGGGMPMIPMATMLNEAGANANTNVNPLMQSQFDDALNPIDPEWINKKGVQFVVRCCALASFVSICANTPETFKNNPTILYLTFIVDSICTLVFTIEMIAKIRIRGLFRGDSAYIFDRWSQFDGIMVIFHLISVFLQVIKEKNLKKYFSL